MKKCRECGETKVLTEFYRHPETADGRLSVCKVCKRRYQANRPSEALRKIERRRNRKPKRKAHLAKNLKRWRKNNPDKVRSQQTRHPGRRSARNAVANAIRDGRLVRQPCEVCGSNERVEAHHEDYSKPLDVNWLCQPHHRQREGRD